MQAIPISMVRNIVRDRGVARAWSGSALLRWGRLVLLGLIAHGVVRANDTALERPLTSIAQSWSFSREVKIPDGQTIPLSIPLIYPYTSSDTIDAVVGANGWIERDNLYNYNFRKNAYKKVLWDLISSREDSDNEVARRMAELLGGNAEVLGRTIAIAGAARSTSELAAAMAKTPTVGFSAALKDAIARGKGLHLTKFGKNLTDALQAVEEVGLITDVAATFAYYEAMSADLQLERLQFLKASDLAYLNSTGVHDPAWTAAIQEVETQLIQFNDRDVYIALMRTFADKWDEIALYGAGRAYDALITKLALANPGWALVPYSWGYFFTQSAEYVDAMHHAVIAATIYHHLDDYNRSNAMRDGVFLQYTAQAMAYRYLTENLVANDSWFQRWIFKPTSAYNLTPAAVETHFIAQLEAANRDLRAIAETIQPAANPVPAVGSSWSSSSITLRWQADPTASRHVVYFGRPGALRRVGETEGNEFSLGVTLEGSSAYQWRVDSVSRHGLYTAVGPTWSFATLDPATVGWIGGAYAYPTTVQQGFPVGLFAAGVKHPLSGLAVDEVEFFVDSDGNGSIGAMDRRLGAGLKSGEDYYWKGSADFDLGSRRILVRARRGSDYSETEAVTLSITRGILAEGNALALGSLRWDDEDGDNLEEGREDIDLEIQLLNTSTETIENVSAVLRSSLPSYLEFRDPDLSYPDMAAGASQWSTGDFNFRINATSASDVGFLLEVTYDRNGKSFRQNLTFTKSFPAQGAYEPKLRVTNFIIDDAPAYRSANNGDGVFQSGERVQLRPVLTNEGNTQANDTRLLIAASSTPGVTYSDQSIYYGGIRAGESKAAPAEDYFTLKCDDRSIAGRFALPLSATWSGNEAGRPLARVLNIDIEPVPWFKIEPMDEGLGVVAPGAVIQTALRITNYGSGAGQVKAIAAAGQAIRIPNTTLPAAVGAGETVSIPIEFDAPAVEGTVNLDLTVETNARISIGGGVASTIVVRKSATVYSGGTATWRETGRIPLTNTHGVVTSDTDGDGQTEIIALIDDKPNDAGANVPQVVIFEQNTAQQWQEVWNSGELLRGKDVGYSTALLALGDFDANGRAEIVVATRSEVAGAGDGNGRIYVIKSTAPNSWTSAWTSTGTAGLITEIAVGDSDGDGRLEIVAATAVRNGTTYEGRIYIQEHSSGLAFSSNLLISNLRTSTSVQYRAFSGLSIGDTDKDGSPELIFAAGSPEINASSADGNDSAQLFVYESTGDNSYASKFAAFTYTTERVKWDYAVIMQGDFDNDGLIEVAVGEADDRNLWVFEIAGPDGWSTAFRAYAPNASYEYSYPGASDPLSMIAFDFDGDGRKELALGRDFNPALHVLQPFGSDSYVAAATLSTQGDPWQLAAFWPLGDPVGTLACAVEGVGIILLQALPPAARDVAPVQAEVSQLTPVVGWPQVITSSIANLGSESEAAVDVRFEELDAITSTVLSSQTKSVGPIARGASVPVSFDWTPTAAGGRVLRLIADQGNIIPELNEENNGTQIAVAVGAVRRSGRVLQDLDFGVLRLGLVTTKVLTIENTGNVPLSLTAIDLPAAFRCTWPGPVTVPAGEAFDLPVEFAPAAVGAYSGAVVVSSDATAGAISGNVAGGAFDNTAPTISDIGDQVVGVNENSGPLGFSIGDAEDAPSALIVAASSTNNELVPGSGILLEGSQAARTLIVTPTSGLSGTAVITVTVTDSGGLSSRDSFTLTVGLAADLTPDAFTFTAVTGAELSNEYTSEPVTITGLNGAAPLAVTGGTYSVNGSPFTSVGGVVMSGDSVRVRQMSSAVTATQTLATLNIGGVVGTFAVTTKAATLPTVTTGVVSDVRANGARVEGTVTSEGGADVTSRGYAFSLTPQPTIESLHVLTDGSGLGYFASTLTTLPLQPATTYHLRAFATNPVGTAYGEERVFTTLPAPTPIATLTVPADGTTVTSPPLDAAKAYWIYAKGTYVLGEGLAADAEFIHPSGGAPYEQHASYAYDLADVFMDGQQVDWLNAATGAAHSVADDNTYRLSFTGNGGGVSFRIVDSGYADNAGSISLSIFELPVAPTGARVISLAGDLAFGEVAVGSTATRVLTIANNGSDALTVSGISYPAGFSGDWQGGIIAAGTTQLVSVTFSPGTAQAYGGMLTVSSNATSGGSGASINGTGASAAGAPAYSNDFSTSLTGWAQMPADAEAFWYTQDGALHGYYTISAGSPGNTQSFLLLDDGMQPTGDWVAEIDFTVASDLYEPTFASSSVAFGIWQSSGSKLSISVGHSAWNWTAAPRGTIDVGVAHWNGGSWQATGLDRTVALDWDPSAWNTARLSRVGSTYRLYVNNTPVLEFDDVYLDGTGKLGLHTYGPKKLDNFRLDLPGGSVVAPRIAVQPASQVVTAGADVTLSVNASGGGLHYQWRRNGVELAGETGAALMLGNVQYPHAGFYDVIVNNAAGTLVSEAARLYVGQANSPYRLTGFTVAEGDIQAIVAAQFGAGSTVADWNEIKAEYGGNLAEFYEMIGVADRMEAMLVRGGQRYYGTSRQYYFQRSDSGLPYAGFAAHDQMNTSYLGSWYVLNMPVLAKLAQPQAPVFSVQPADRQVESGGNTSFSVSVTGTPVPSIQWQVSSDGGESWADISDGGAYSGATAPTLLLTGAAPGMHGQRYRAVATNAVQAGVVSNAAQLSVTAPVGDVLMLAAWDFASSSLPAGWAAWPNNYGNHDFANGRMNAYATDATHRIYRPLSLPDGTTELRIEFRGNTADSYHGGGNYLVLGTANGEYQISHGWGSSSPNGQMNSDIHAGSSLLGRQYMPRSFEEFRYMVTFRDGQIIHQGVKTNGVVLFEHHVSAPGFTVASINRIDLGLYVTTLMTLWVDDVQITAIGTATTAMITLNASPTEGGTVSGAGTFAVGSTQTITAAPNPGFVFTAWQDGSTSAIRQVTVPQAGVAYTANFEPAIYRLTVSVSPADGGTVNVSPQKDGYTWNESATVTAIPAAGRQFSSWTITDSEGTRTQADYPLTVAMGRDVAVTANFTAINTAPTIETIGDIVVARNVVGEATFTIGDDQTPASGLMVTASSSNQTLVPAGYISISGSGSTRSIRVTSDYNQVGTAIITITVSDGILSTSRSFTFTVTLPQSGSAQRSLPEYFYAGGDLTVTIVVTPSQTTAVYALEDGLPDGWAFKSSATGGAFDIVNRRVKFGPYFDNASRTLTYVVTAPADAASEAVFGGVISEDGNDASVGGDQVVAKALLHPADTNPGDSRIVISEVTAYGAAWKRGDAWAIAPTTIPIAYVTRAGFLWKGGETYHFDVSTPSAPLWWASGMLAAALPPSLAASPLPQSLPTGTAPGTAVRTITGADIAVVVTPDAAVMAYALEEQIPAGLTASDITQSGAFDAVNRKVKWGPFFDNVPRTFAYRLNGADATYSLTGIASFDGADEVVTGDSSLVLATQTGYGLWLSAYFNSTEMTDPLVSGPNADPDGDGWSNLMEYALGLNPLAPSVAGLPEAGTTSADWTCTYTRPADRSDLTYEVEVSTNLTDWTTVTVHERIVTGATETWRARYPLANAANVFFRLKVTQL